MWFKRNGHFSGTILVKKSRELKPMVYLDQGNENGMKRLEIGFCFERDFFKVC